MPDADEASIEFLRAYTDAITGLKRLRGKDRFPTGTIGAGCLAYMASDVFAALAPSTRDNRRRIVSKIAEAYGRARMVDLRAKHIRQDMQKLDPHPANSRLKVWRHMCRYWLDAGFTETDPAREVVKRQTAKAKGAQPWTRADVAQYRAYWPIGTQQRLAFEIMHRTCASISDACRLGPAFVSNGWLIYRRGKSTTEAAIPMDGGPDWFEHTDHLQECLEVAPRHMTWLTTRQGAARSPKAAAQWFSRACTAAGLPHLSAHGIRKHRAAVFRENGADIEQRMAVLGHETESVAGEYSRSADLRRII